MSEQVFTNIKVLDCTEGIAGPYCTKLLADFGAQVIKVEKPGEGDITRKAGPFLNDENDQEKSGTFYYLNTNKQCLTLNLDTGTGVGILKKLLKETDVFIHCFSSGKLESLGITDELLKEINPDLITTSVSAFGQTGPYRDYAATNLTVYGLGGAMYTQRPDTNPVERPVIEGGFQAEYITGIMSYIATVAALINKLGHREHITIDVAAMECVTSTLMGHIAEYAYIGLSRRTCPYAIHGYPIGYSVPCKDGWISLTPGIGGAPNIPLLIERPELLDDPLFTDPRARMADPEMFNDIIVSWLEEHDKWSITRQAQELRLAFTPVLSLKELVEDEQVIAREFIAQSEHPAMGKVAYPGAPAKLSETGWCSGRAPLLGEHNEVILGKLGYTMENVNQFKKDGII